MLLKIITEFSVRENLIDRVSSLPEKQCTARVFHPKISFCYQLFSCIESGRGKHLHHKLATG